MSNPWSLITPGKPPLDCRFPVPDGGELVVALRAGTPLLYGCIQDRVHAIHQEHGPGEDGGPPRVPIASPLGPEILPVSMEVAEVAAIMEVLQVPRDDAPRLQLLDLLGWVHLESVWRPLREFALQRALDHVLSDQEGPADPPASPPGPAESASE